MRTGDSTLQSEPVRLRGQRFDVTRLWIVRFVAMQINPETAFGRNCAEPPDRSRSIGHRPFEMWNTADYLYPKIQRSEQILFRTGRPKQPDRAHPLQSHRVPPDHAGPLRCGRRGFQYQCLTDRQEDWHA